MAKSQLIFFFSHDCPLKKGYVFTESHRKSLIAAEIIFYWLVAHAFFDFSH
jgi:hypothetical protein